MLVFYMHASALNFFHELNAGTQTLNLLYTLFPILLQVPAFARRSGDTLGPFRPEAEMLNGRAAMIGFASLLVLEGIRGVPLF